MLGIKISLPLSLCVGMLATLFVLGPLIWIDTSHAGDVADREIIGFSSDGQIFAFEEYGVQDGSGFPFSTIYVIDTRANEWVEGSPVRVRLDNETAPLGDARANVQTQAADLLKRNGVQAGRKGLLLGTNPVTERSADPKQMSVVPRIVVPPIDDEVHFNLRAFKMNNPTCESYGFDETMGLAARLRIGEGEPILLHHDKRLPGSRGCPIDYTISDVIAYDLNEKERVYVLLVNVFTHGFEGPDRRFIALPMWVTAPE